MKVYYAHCQSIYGTPQEARDVDTLTTLGFMVENPSDEKHRSAAERIRADGGGSIAVMEYFTAIVDECDAVAFRALPDGSIPAGVAKEVERCRETGRLVIELPSCILQRVLTVEETREYLKEIGQR